MTSNQDSKKENTNQETSTCLKGDSCHWVIEPPNGPTSLGKCKKLFRNFQGPYIVEKRINNSTYLLRHFENNRNKLIRNIKHLRVLPE